MAREARLFLYICSVPAVQRSLPYDTTAGHYRTTIMIVCCQYRTTVVTAQRPLPHLPADAKQPPPHNYHTLIGVMTAKVTYISRGVSTLSSVNLTASPPCCQSARYCLLHLFLSANNSYFCSAVRGATNATAGSN